MTSKSKFEVYMHRDLVDALDEGFSPGDGIQAIDDVFVGLPKLHRSKHSKKSPSLNSNWLRLFRCRLEWYPLGISYVQIGNDLHVIELFDYEKWHESHPRHVVPQIPAEVRK